MPINPIKPTTSAKQALEKQQQQPPATEDAPALPDNLVKPQSAEEAMAEARAYGAKHGMALGRSNKAAADLRPGDTDNYHSIKLSDGRLITLGPPPVPCDLVTNEMFKKRESNVGLLSDFQSATVCLYIRKIDNDYMPLCKEWRECVELMHRLGELSWRAVNSAYVHYFGASDAYWTEVKN